MIVGLVGATTSVRCESGCDGPPEMRTLTRPDWTNVGVFVGLGAAALVAGVVMIVWGASSGGHASAVALTSDGVAFRY